MTRTAVVLILFVAGTLQAQPTRSTSSISMTGEAPAELAELDTLMTSFLQESGAPGAALAVAHQGRLVYARGFGLADVERKKPVEPTSLFRVASVSKPVTLAAICLLAERGKLKFSDHVLDILKLSTPDSLDPRWKKITIAHLVEHKGGFTNDGGDPMFRSVEIAREQRVPPPAMPKHIIQFMLKQPLGFEPGTKVHYSNFGYCLLGRVIEQISGKSYEEFVKTELLKPLGITSMQIGRTMSTAKGEVRYVDSDPDKAPCVFANYLGRKVPTPYGAWCLEAMDAHGGWIASAVDLVRFGSAIDFPERFPVVKGQTFNERFTPLYYHYGLFSGTSSLLYRHSNGLTFAVLFNSRLSSSGKELADEFHKRVKPVFADIKKWPTGDLFSKYLK